MNRHEAVWEWLQGCESLTDLYFNLGQVNDQSVSLIPSESEKEVFIDGSREMYYDCTLIRWFVGSFEPNDASNISKLVDFEEVSEWVKAQNDAQNYPAFPEGMTVNEVSILPNESGFIVEQNTDAAKFTVQFRIEYYQKS